MSGRCKACNASMSEEDMCRKFPPTADGKREYSNLCGDCHETAIAIMFNFYYEPSNESLPLYESRAMPKVSE